MKDLLVDMLSIYSPSGSEKGIIEYIQSRFNKSGFEVGVDEIGNCFVSIPGVGDPVLLCAHMDTVTNGTVPVFEEVDGIITSANDAILGLDDKASVAIILSAVDLLTKEGAHRPIEVLLSVQEEPGCLGAAHAMKNNSFPIKSNVGISFDLPKPPGSILQGAAGIWRGVIVFEGKSAHSAHPEGGANAIGALSQFTIDFLKRNDSEDVRVNVGHVSGGKTAMFNLVPDLAAAEVEIRSKNDISDEVKKLEKSFGKYEDDFGVSARIENEFMRISGYEHKESDQWIAELEQGMRSRDIIPVRESYSYGASDANILQEHGINVVVLGNGVQDTHATDENVHLGDLTRIRDFLVAALKN